MTVLLINVHYGVRFIIVWHLDDQPLLSSQTNKQTNPTECDSLDTAVYLESDANNTECCSHSVSNSNQLHARKTGRIVQWYLQDILDRSLVSHWQILNHKITSFWSRMKIWENITISSTLPWHSWFGLPFAFQMRVPHETMQVQCHWNQSKTGY